jgi:riboflavin kinase/FMN adenylyltransferase
MHKSVVTLGTFDGVHRGHQALLRKVVERARVIKGTSIALAFDMPPRHAGDPIAKPVLVTTLPEKLGLMKSMGIKVITLLIFNRKTKSTEPEEFFKDTIVRKLRAREMVVGPKVAFGKNRAGRLPLLRRLGKKYGVCIHVVPKIGKGASQVSSRRIRMLLAAGRVEQANALLGYPYSVEGTVVHGDKRGRRLGFPTANIAADPSKILPPGVFWVHVNGMDGLCNVGVRPTFTPHSHAMHCEVFILSPKRGALYGKKLRVTFLRRIRSEKRFESPRALTQQIAKDLALAKRWIRTGHH